MPVITILPEDSQSPPAGYRAVADGKQSQGPTIGQALDALTREIGPRPRRRWW